MIHHALALLETELEAYIREIHESATEEFVQQGNVALLEAGGEAPTGLEERVVISLVNIEEESAFKNLPNFSKTVNGSVRYQNAPVFLNLYLLFSSNFNQYETALEHLAEVIQFFQGKHVFNLKNAPGFNGDEIVDADLAEIQLILDLYTMTFEQINHLWGSLGGRQLPFVMYKARLVKVLDRRTTGVGPIIEQIGTGGKGIEPEGGG